MTLTRSLIEYEPQVDLTDGVARTFAWYRRHVFSGSGVSAR
jgi:hypothetical protein